MERKVYLEGVIAKKFGSEFTIYAESVADVWRCLTCNFPELRQYLIECHEKNIGFLCKVGDKGLDDEEEMLLTLGEGDIFISPQPAGSKSAFGKILAAIVIVALVAYGGAYILNATAALGGQAGVGFGLAGLKAGLGLAMTSGFGLAALGVGVSLALSGIQQMMAPDPSVDSPNTSAGENSYLFQGSEQSVLEGDPVPVAYGEIRIPGRPISFELRNKERVYSSGYHNGGTGSLPGDYKYYSSYTIKT
jgi:predicted phage tail protein